MENKELSILLLDILDHQEFSFQEDIVASINFASEYKLDIHVAEPNRGDILPEFDDFHGVIITGSFRKFNEVHSCKTEIENAIVEAHRRKSPPVLGLCMTHQLIAHLFGAKVERHPLRRELGTLPQKLTSAGKSSLLYEDIDEIFHLSTCHWHDVIEPPPDARVLSYNERSSCQSFQLDNLYGIQAHPEVKAETLRTWVKDYAAKEELVCHGYIRNIDEVDIFLKKNIYDTDERILIFRNFIRICSKVPVLK